MIYNLRKKFIFISAASVLLVFLLIFLIICFVSASQLNGTMDMLTDVISSNGGVFPNFNEMENPPELSGPHEELFTPETRLSTRFFTVWMDNNNNIIRENVEQISSVSQAEAREYAVKAVKSGNERGWISDYRYKVYNTDYGKTVVFVNGEMNRGMKNRVLYSVFFVLSGSFIVSCCSLFLFQSGR